MNLLLPGFWATLEHAVIYCMLYKFTFLKEGNTSGDGPSQTELNLFDFKLFHMAPL